MISGTDPSRCFTDLGRHVRRARVRRTERVRATWFVGRFLGPCFSLFLGLLAGSIACASPMFGCGYQFANRANTLPGHIKRVSIDLFQNQTNEPNLENIFYQAFQQEFATDRRLNLTSLKKADAVLYGVVKSFSVSPLHFDSAGYPSKYSSTIQLDLILFDNVKNEIYWKYDNYSRSEEYDASTQAGQSEDNELLVIKRLAVDLAQSVHRDIMAKF